MVVSSVFEPIDFQVQNLQPVNHRAAPEATTPHKQKAANVVATARKSRRKWTLKVATDEQAADEAVESRLESR